MDPICLALFGELDSLKLIEDIDDQEIQEIILAATFMGHLHIVTWASKFSFIWPHEITLYASRYGYFEILSFVIQKNAQIHQKCLEQAAKNNHHDCVEILLKYVPNIDGSHCHNDMLLFEIWDDLSAEAQDKLICKN